MFLPITNLLFASLTCGGPDLAQAPRGEQLPANVFRGFNLTELDGELLALGPDYRAHFEPEGLCYVPALGAAVERIHPLTLSAQAVLRGGVDALGLPRSAAAEQRGMVAQVERWAGVTERWEARAEGVELSYVFEQQPKGSGELVVRLALESDLAVRAAGAGLEFVHYDDQGRDWGGVSIGGVTGIDAQGHTVAGSLRLASGALELVLPEDFAESARYPVVLDPLVGTKFSIESSNTLDDQRPDVASNGAGYLVVWQRSFSSTDRDLRGQRLLDTGALSGALIAVTAGTGVYSDASVGYVRKNDAYVVAFEWSSGSLFADTDVRVRGVVGSTGAVGAEFTLLSTTANELDPQVGGDSTLLDDDVLVVFRQSGTDLKLSQVNVSSTGVVGIAASTISIPGTDSTCLAPAISRSGGATGRYLITWTEPILVPPFTPRDAIRGCVYSKDQVLVASTVTLASGSTNAANSRVDGDGHHWAIVYEALEPTGTDTDVYARVATLNFSTLQPLGNAVLVEGDANDDEYAPDIACTGNAFLAVWTDEAALVEADLGFKVLDSYALSTVENEAVIDSGTTNEQFPAVASEFSGNGSFTSNDDDLLMVWSDLESLGTVTGEISGQLFEPNAGTRTNLGGGCGGGFNTAGSASVGNSGFSLRLQEGVLTANQKVFLLLGLEQAVIPCDSCVIGIDPFEAFVVPTLIDDTDFNASVSLSIPNDTQLAGVGFYTQWVSTTITSGQCSTYFTNFSDLVRVTIE